MVSIKVTKNVFIIAIDYLNYWLHFIKRDIFNVSTFQKDDIFN